MILAGLNKKLMDRVIQDIKDAKLNITVENDTHNFLGVNMDRCRDGSIALTQPHLINKVLKAMNKDQLNPKPKDTPPASSWILKKHQDSTDFDGSFNHRSVVGMLNYRDKRSRCDIACATHQAARFVDGPKREHREALHWLAWCLMGTCDEGMVHRPDFSEGLELFMDTDFAGNWGKTDTENRDTAQSRHGHIIRYAGCPIVWKSQLLGEIALSSTESECTGLSHALWEVIPIMELPKEMRRRKVKVTTMAEMQCKSLKTTVEHLR